MNPFRQGTMSWDGKKNPQLLLMDRRLSQKAREAALNKVARCFGVVYFAMEGEWQSKGLGIGLRDRRGGFCTTVRHCTSERLWASHLVFLFFLFPYPAFLSLEQGLALCVHGCVCEYKFVCMVSAFHNEVLISTVGTRHYHNKWII